MLAKPLDQNKYTTWCCAGFTGPLSICLVPRGHWCAGSARGREAPEIQDTAGTARGVTERSYDGTAISISTPRVPRKGSLNDRNLAAFRLP